MKTYNIDGKRAASWARSIPLAVALGMAGTAAAQDCSIQERVNNLGQKNNIDVARLPAMSEITDAEVIRTRAGWSDCPRGSFDFDDNILSTRPGCRGDFLVTGIEADCEPGDGGAEVNDIAQVPLFIAEQSDPNVMFLLDDSGSMHFEIMPDENVFFEKANGAVIYLFPRADGVYGGDDYSNNVATVDDVVFNAITRSPQQNTVYYDPGITYRPWIKSDATHYPPADSSCALHNPENAGAGASHCRDLTVSNTNYNDNRWRNCDSDGNCTSTTETMHFWPATYFWHTGGDPWDKGNYDRQEIRPTTASYSGHGRQFRSDCADAENGVCTYEEEIRNFANWYTYYRSRILAARAGIGFAFARQGSGMRLGFGALNRERSDVDGVETAVVERGVRSFRGADRESFFNTLYSRDVPAGGTPLRQALDAAGRYFSRTDNRGPWGAAPGSDDDTAHLSCRRSYTVLMTDGFWSGTEAFEAGTEEARRNNDGRDGALHTGVGDLSYRYEARAPFKDDYGNTLADVAMYYWKRDLRPALENNVAPLERNPAFWQHMTTFGVGLGVSGSIDPEAAFNAIDTGDAIDWPDPEPGVQNCSGDICPARLDDLLHAGLNSRGGFFSASDPSEFASELASVLQTISEETGFSASSIASNSTRLDNGAMIFQARFNTRDWSSELLAFDLNSDGSIKSVVWSTDEGESIPPPGLRNIFTAQGGAATLVTTGMEFDADNWDSFTEYQRSALRGDGEDDDGMAVIDWLRGDQSREGEGGQRVRDRLLGDIVNSDPFYVGATENFGYSALPGEEGEAYRGYLFESSGKSGRRGMLYVGANDGMLHGFDAQTGEELFAYIPLAVYDNLPALTKPDYQHRYYVDGSPRAGDAYIGENWKTVLVGATGAGGRSVFALDVTDPDNVGPGDLLWEFATGDSDSDKLGVAMSEPVIARLKAGGRWVAIFGNGYASGDNVKLMIVGLESGSLLKAIDTGVSGDGNGLASVVPVDTNDDRITDFVYAGDLEGNLWKFDLSGDNEDSWGVALTDGGDPAPLFRAVDDDGAPQPITSRPVVGRHEISGLMVYFGTGKYFENSDAQIEDDPQIQTFYGIRDRDRPVARDDLQEQTILFEGVATIGNADDGETGERPFRVVSNNGAGAPSADGWYIDLLPPSEATGVGERSVSRPLLRSGRVIFTTVIPDRNPCGFGGTGWLMELDASNGGRLGFSVFDINDDTFFNNLDYIEAEDEFLPVSGIGHREMITTPGIVGAGELEYKYTSGSSGSIGVTREKSSDAELGRQSWRQLQ